jgi:hypothetical protein
MISKGKTLPNIYLETLGDDLRASGTGIRVTGSLKIQMHEKKLLKIEAEDQEFAKVLRLLEQFVLTVKNHNYF